MRVVDIINLGSSAYTLLRERVTAMRANGIDARIICMDGPHVDRLREAGVPVVTAHLPRGLEPVAMVRSLAEITLQLRRIRPDIVHTHCSMPGFIGRLAARLAGVPIVIHTVHGFHFHDGSRGPGRWAFIWAERFAGLFTDLLLTQNHADMDRALSHGIVRRDRIAHIGNGVTLERFAVPASRSNEGRPLVLTCIARMEPVKNHRMLFEAACLLKAHGLHFEVWLIGDGDRREAYEAECERLGLSQTVRFLGYRHDVAALLARTDIAVLTSLKEGIPRAVLEPMAMGLPVVATRVTGTCEVVRDGESGYLVPVGDITALAGALSGLMRDPGLRERLGARGREIVVTEFNESVITANLERVYRERLARRGLIARAPLPRTAET